MNFMSFIFCCYGVKTKTTVFYLSSSFVLFCNLNSKKVKLRDTKYVVCGIADSVPLPKIIFMADIFELT